MRIQSYMQVQPMYNTQKTNRTQKSTQTGFSDELLVLVTITVPSGFRRFLFIVKKYMFRFRKQTKRL